jgi:hypothetical protein
MVYRLRMSTGTGICIKYVIFYAYHWQKQRKQKKEKKWEKKPD